MLKRLMPYAHATNIFEIDIEFFKYHKLTHLFLDLDNTLESHDVKLPSERTINFIKTLKNNNITPVIISNNRGKRVSVYAEALGIDYVKRAGKPLSRNIKKYIKQKNIDKNSVFMVGDQMFTDISSANGAKIKSILVDKIVNSDQLVTKINRFFEGFFRRRLIKQNKFKNWRELYGKIN